MDLIHIKQLISDLEIDDPAFESTKFKVAEIPRRWLGAYYPPENLIVISPHASEAVVLHEMGHRFYDYHFHDISERGAEMFRQYIMEG